MNWLEIGRDKIILPMIGVALTLVGGFLLNFLSGGQVVAALGGVTKLEISRVVDFDIDTTCGKVFNRRKIGNAEKYFCSLTDVSIYGQSNTGWRACRFDTQDGIRWLVADLHGAQCEKSDGVEIYCKAQCINWN